MEHFIWFGARTLYEFGVDRNDGSILYEERVVLLKASSFDEAIEKAEREASEYASGDSGMKYLNFVTVFSIDDEEGIGEGTEVFSLVRGSELEPKEYIDRFFDTGKERTKHSK